MGAALLLLHPGQAFLSAVVLFKLCSFSAKVIITYRETCQPLTCCTTCHCRWEVLQHADASSIQSDYERCLTCMTICALRLHANVIQKAKTTYMRLTTTLHTHATLSFRSW